MTTQCMNCIALNRLCTVTDGWNGTYYVNLCATEDGMPAWTNRTGGNKEVQKGYDCLDCPYLCDCTEDEKEEGYMDIRTQISCPAYWDRSMSEALDAAIRKTMDREVCYEAVFDSNGYYCSRGGHMCEHQYPNSATCTHVPRAYTAQETTPEVHEQQMQQWFDECKAEPEYPEWKQYGVDVTVDYDRIHAKVPKGATLIYGEDFAYFLTKRHAVRFLIIEGFKHFGRIFGVLFPIKKRRSIWKTIKEGLSCWIES